MYIYIIYYILHICIYICLNIYKDINIIELYLAFYNI